MAGYQDRVTAVHRQLLARGHIEPVVAVEAGHGRWHAGPVDLPAEIGSVTKLFTGLLLAALAERGTVNLDSPITRYLPAGTPVAAGVEAITMEALASHQAGLPRLPPNLPGPRLSLRPPRDPYATFDEAQLLAALAETRIRGSGVRYSNFGVGLLGYLLGRADGTDYATSLHRRVLVPLGLSSASFDDTPLRQGHHRRRPVPPWHLASLAGAGGLHCSARDLLQFLATVRDGTGPLAGPIAETLRPRSTGPGPIVGLGWFMLGSGALLLHDGGTGGSRCEVRIERASGVCVVVIGDARRGTPKAAAQLLNPRR